MSGYDPLAGYTPGWRNKRPKDRTGDVDLSDTTDARDTTETTSPPRRIETGVSNDDPLAGYTNDWRAKIAIPMPPVVVSKPEAPAKTRTIDERAVGNVAGADASRPEHKPPRARAPESIGTGYADSLETLIGQKPEYQLLHDEGQGGRSRAPEYNNDFTPQIGLTPSALAHASETGDALNSGFPAPKGQSVGRHVVGHEFGHMAEAIATHPEDFEHAADLHELAPIAKRMGATSQEFAEAFNAATHFLTSKRTDLAGQSPDVQEIARVLLKQPLFAEHPLNGRTPAPLSARAPVTPPVAPRDATRVPLERGVVDRPLTGIARNLPDAARITWDQLAVPRRAAELLASPATSALEFGRYTGQDINDVTDPEANDVAAAMGVPRVTKKEGGEAAAQVGAMAAGGAINAGVTRLLTKAAVKAGLAGDVAATGVVGGAGKLAPTAGAAAEGATIGAAYDPEHPVRGAAAGGGLGALADVLSRARMGPPPREPNLAADRTLPRSGRPTSATVTPQQPAPAAAAPDYDVTTNTVDEALAQQPPSRIEQIRQARAAKAGTPVPSTAPTPDAPLEATPPDHLAVRVGPIGPDGAYFSRTAQIGPETKPYDLSGVNLANGGDPHVVQQLTAEAMKDPSLTPEQHQALATLASDGMIDYDTNDRVPQLRAAAQRLGYDGLQVFEADDAELPSSVFIWNIRKVQPGVVPEAAPPVAAEPAPAPSVPPPHTGISVAEQMAEHRRAIESGRSASGEELGDALIESHARKLAALEQHAAAKRTPEEIDAEMERLKAVDMPAAEERAREAKNWSETAAIGERLRQLRAERLDAISPPLQKGFVRGTATRYDKHPHMSVPDGVDEHAIRTRVRAYNEVYGHYVTMATPQSPYDKPRAPVPDRTRQYQDDISGIAEAHQEAMNADPDREGMRRGQGYIAGPDAKKLIAKKLKAAGAPHSPKELTLVLSLAHKNEMSAPEGLKRPGDPSIAAWYDEIQVDAAIQAAIQHHRKGPAEKAEKPAEQYDYSSTQLDLPPEHAAAIQQLGAKIPDADLAKDGREEHPHITVKYGLHGSDPEKVRALLADEPPITVTLGKTSIFPNGESNSGDVVKVDVDSPALHALNKKIADALPHTDTHPGYKPHATVAYVKPGLGKKYAGDASLEGQQITLDRLTFSGKDGTKVEIPLGGKETAAPLDMRDAVGMLDRGQEQERAARKATLFAEGERVRTKGGEMVTVEKATERAVSIRFDDGGTSIVQPDLLSRVPAAAQADLDALMAEKATLDASFFRKDVSHSEADRRRERLRAIDRRESELKAQLAEAREPAPPSADEWQQQVESARSIPTNTDLAALSDATDAELAKHYQEIEEEMDRKRAELEGSRSSRRVVFRVEKDLGYLKHRLDLVGNAIDNRAAKRAEAAKGGGPEPVVDEREAERDEVVRPKVQRLVGEEEARASSADVHALVTAAIDAIHNNALPSGAKAIRDWAAGVLGRPYALKTWQVDDAYDAIEGAANQQLHELSGSIVGAGWPKASEILTLAKELEAKWFTGRLRSAGMMERQQFSTPLPIATAAAYALNVVKGEKVLEPTAGTGNLVNALRGGDVVIDVNELDPRRADVLRALGYQPTEEDALRLPMNGKRYNAVVMNPPFGSYRTGKYGGQGALPFKDSDVSQRFVAAALHSLVEGGRLVAVMPSNVLLPGGADFRRWLRTNHTPLLYLESPAGAYESRGTDTDTVLLVVDKGPPPKKWVSEKEIRDINWHGWESVIKRFEPGGEFHRTIAHEPARDVAPVTGAGARQTKPVHIETRDAQEATRGAESESGPAARRAVDAGPGGESAGRIDVGGRVESGEPARGSGTGAEPRTERPADVVADAASGLPRGSDPVAGATADVVPPLPRGRVEPTADDSPERRAELEAANHSAVFTPYVVELGERRASHPRLVVETRAMAGMPAPPIHTTIQSRAVDKAWGRDGAKGGISDEQADAILRTTTAWKQGHGILISDDVGVGKAREAAGAALEAIAQGAKRILYLTKNETNLIDAQREFRAVASGSEEGDFPATFVSVGDFPRVKKGEEALPRPAGPTVYLAHSYNFRDFADALGEAGLDTLLADEAHEFKNLFADRGMAWANLHTQLLAKPDSRFAYFTATPGVSLDELGYLFGLKEWPVGGFSDWVERKLGKKPADEEEGDVDEANAAANAERAKMRQLGEAGMDALADDDRAIGKGKKQFLRGKVDVFAMRVTPAETEQVMRELKGSGKYISRDLWRGGVKFAVETVPLADKSREAIRARERYDTAAALARDITEAAQKFGRMNAKVKTAGLDRALIQSYMKQLLFDLRFPRVLELADEALAKGQQVVISVNTVAGDADLAEGLSAADAETPVNKRLESAINRINTVEVRKEGKGDTVEFVDLGEIPEALMAVSGLRDRLKQLPPLRDPIRAIEDHFGAKRVAAITGKVSAKGRKQRMSEFQAGQRTVAVISRAGKVGISLHDVNGKPRRMLVADYEWSADTFKQELGRVDRTGQRSNPEVQLVASDIAGERKFAATIAARMASLGATSKGSAEATGTDALDQFDVADSISLQAMKQTMEQLFDRPDRQYFTGSKFHEWKKDVETGMWEKTPKRRPDEVSIRDFLLDLMMFPVEAANRVWAMWGANRDALRQGEDVQLSLAKRTSRLKGDVTRVTPLSAKGDPALTLYEVKNADGERKGIVQGFVTHYIHRLQGARGTDAEGSPKSRRYIQFTASDGQLVSGLEVSPSEIRRIKEDFETGERSSISPNEAWDDLQTGERVGVNGPENTEWTLRLRKDGRIAIDGATLAQHGRALNGFAQYATVGNLLYIPNERAAFDKFVTRFPLQQPTPKPAKRKGGGGRASPRDGGDDEVSALFSPAAPGTPLGAQVAAAQGTPTTGPAAARAARDVKTLADIARTMADMVDVPLRQGRFNAGRRKAAGVFFPDKEVARLIRFDKLGTAAHEIGHYVSMKYLRNPTRKNAAARGAPPLTIAMKRELVQMGKDLYGTRKPNAGYGEEGIAEWANFYVTDPAALAAKAPLFSAWAEREVLGREPALKQAMDQAQQDFAEYKAAPATARVDAMIDVHPKRRFLPSTRTLATAMLDDLNEIRLAVEDIGRSTSPAKNAYLLARLTRGGAGMAEEMIERGVIDPDTGARVTKGVAEVLRELKPSDVQPFRRYLVAERTIEMAKRGVDTGIAFADAKALVAKYEAQYKPLAEELWKISNALIDYRQAKGLLTKQEASDIKHNNQRRVGFYRVFDESETAAGRAGTGRSFGRNSSGLQKMKGSARTIIDPLESIISDVYKTVQQSHAAEVLSALVKHANATQGGGRVIEVLTEVPQRAMRIPVERIQDQLAQLGFEVPNGNLVPMQGIVMAFEDATQPGPKEQKDLVRPLVINGERKWIQIHDAQLFNALAGLGTPQMPQWLRFLSIPTRTLRAGATLTAEFITRNPVKDAFTAAVYSRAGTRPPGWDLGRGLFHVLKADHLYQDWRLDGGDNAAMLGLDRVDLHKHAKEILRSPLSRRTGWVLHPIDTLRMLSSLFENATRVGEYVSVRKKFEGQGMPPKDARVAATMAARDVTIDFAKAGEIGRQVNQIVAFFNANVQGWDKLYREFRHNPETVIPRLLAWITLPSLLLWYLQKDDPAYQEVPAWQKMMAWVVVQRGPDGQVKHIWRIPKPPELGILFGSVPVTIADWVHTHDARALDGLGDGLSQLNPMHIPEALQPLIEWWANKNFFTGRQIVPEGLSKLPAGEQATSRTGELARAVGDATHLSPAKLENTVKGYTGGLGTYGLDLGNLLTREIRSAAGASPLPHPQERRGDLGPSLPLSRGFMVRVPQLDAQSVQDVMDRFEAADAHRQAWRRKLESGDRAGAKAYLEAHKKAIESVGTREDGFYHVGALRDAHELIVDAQRISRDADNDTRERIADIAVRASRAALSGERVSRFDLIRMKREAAQGDRKGKQRILRARSDVR